MEYFLTLFMYICTSFKNQSWNGLGWMSSEWNIHQHWSTSYCMSGWERKATFWMTLRLAITISHFSLSLHVSNTKLHRYFCYVFSVIHFEFNMVLWVLWGSRYSNDPLRNLSILQTWIHLHDMKSSILRWPLYENPHFLHAIKHQTCNAKILVDLSHRMKHCSSNFVLKCVGWVLKIYLRFFFPKPRKCYHLYRHR